MEYYIITDIMMGEVSETKIPIYSRKTRLAKGDTGLVLLDKDIQLASSGMITFCDETAQWEYSKEVCTGVMDKSMKPVVIKKETYKNVVYIEPKGNQVILKDEQLAEELGLMPAKNGNYWYAPGQKYIHNFSDGCQTIQTFPIPMNTTHNADSGNKMFKIITDLYSKFNPQMDKNTKLISRLLGGLTFGVEFETSEGSLQSSCLGNLGLVPLIDGSLNSRDQYEYTTVILKGAKGMDTLKRVCNRLNYQCKVDKTCAMHVHIGSLPKNKEFIVSLYQLFYLLQNELFSIVPHYKKHEQSIMGKAKEYSEHLVDLGFTYNDLKYADNKNDYNKEINSMFNTLVNFVSCGKNLGKDFNTKNMKENEPWQRQWFCPTRYYALNVVNYFFSSGTVEFRMHGPTLNFQKTSIWLLLCIGIVRYAAKYPHKILVERNNIKLGDIVNEFRTNFGEVSEPTPYFNFVANTINNYIALRRKMFREQYMQAVHNTLNGRSNINAEHIKNAIVEFTLDSLPIKEIQNLY